MEKGAFFPYVLKKPARLNAKWSSHREGFDAIDHRLGPRASVETNPDYYAVTVMNYILGAGGFSSRLMDSIRDKQGLAYGIMSHFDTRLMPGAFFINLQTRTDVTNQAITGVLTEVKGIRNAPVTDQELREAKSFIIAGFPCASLQRKLANVCSGGVLKPRLGLFHALSQSHRKVPNGRVLRAPNNISIPAYA